jgi:hypothetical protein
MSSQPNLPTPPINSWNNGQQTNAYGQPTPPSPLSYPPSSINPLAAATPYGQPPPTDFSTSPPANPPIVNDGYRPNLPVQSPVNIPPGQSNYPPPYSPTNVSPVGNPGGPGFPGNAPPPPFDHDHNGTDVVDNQPINTIQRQSSGGEDSYDEIAEASAYKHGPSKTPSNLRPLTCVEEDSNSNNAPPRAQNRRQSMEDGPRGGAPGFNRYPPPPPPQHSPRSPFPQQRPPPNRFSPYPLPQRPREQRPFYRGGGGDNAPPYGPPRGMRPPPPRQRFPPPPRPGFRPY